MVQRSCRILHGEIQGDIAVQRSCTVLVRVRVGVRNRGRGRVAVSCRILHSSDLHSMITTVFTLVRGRSRATGRGRGRVRSTWVGVRVTVRVRCSP